MMTLVLSCWMKSLESELILKIFLYHNAFNSKRTIKIHSFLMKVTMIMHFHFFMTCLLFHTVPEISNRKADQNIEDHFN
jgi:hypothetical protein